MNKLYKSKISCIYQSDETAQSNNATRSLTFMQYTNITLLLLFSFGFAYNEVCHLLNAHFKY